MTHDVPPAIEIVPYLPRHADGVRALILPIQQAEFAIPITLADQPDLLDVPGVYLRGDGGFWVALARDEVVGTIALLGIGEHRVALRKMFVHADHRGSAHGVARRLLDTVLLWCAARGVRDVHLGTIEKFRAAHRFYEKNGFREVARASLPASFPAMAVDDKFYHLRIADEPGVTTDSDALAAASLVIVRAYLAALEAGAIGEALARFFTPDALQVELPNRLNPAGGRSDLATLLERAERGRGLLAEQVYTVRSELARGARVALEATWSAVLAVPLGALDAGAEMRAHFAMFFELDGGRIASQRNYDCFEP